MTTDTIPDVMVERKLSGLYDKLTIDIPWTTFERFMSYCRGWVDSEYDAIVSDGQIMANQKVIEAFERKIREFIDNVVAEPDYHFDWDVDSLLDAEFQDEIEAAREAAMKRRQEENERLLAEANLRIDDGGVVMKIDPQDFTRLASIMEMYGIKYK